MAANWGVPQRYLLFAFLTIYVWYYYNNCMVLLQQLYGTITTIVWYYYNNCMVLLQQLYGTITTIVWYYYNNCMVLLQQLLQVGCSENCVYFYMFPKIDTSCGQRK